MTEDKRHQLDELKLSDILSYCVCRAFTTEEYIRGANKQIANLKKENTELKEQNKSYEQLIDTGPVTLMKDRLKNYKQLTKAKELLKKWVELYKPKLEGYPITPIQKQTEQFLKEVER